MYQLSKKEIETKRTIPELKQWTSKVLNAFGKSAESSHAFRTNATKEIKVFREESLPLLWLSKYYLNDTPIQFKQMAGNQKCDVEVLNEESYKYIEIFHANNSYLESLRWEALPTRISVPVNGSIAVSGSKKNGKRKIAFADEIENGMNLHEEEFLFDLIIRNVRKKVAIYQELSEMKILLLIVLDDILDKTMGINNSDLIDFLTTEIQPLVERIFAKTIVISSSGTCIEI